MRLLLILLLLFTIPVLAQQSRYRQLDHAVATVDSISIQISGICDSARVKGLSIAIIERGKVASTINYGLRNNAEPVNGETVFYAASLTKPVFAFLVLKLVEANVIDLDSPLNKYDRSAPPESTARKILSHNSYDRYRYSNERYNILGNVIEKHTGRSLQDLAAEYVFGPAGMSRTAFTWKKEFEENYAEGHSRNGSNTGAVKSSSSTAAASLLTSSIDYARFINHITDRRNLKRKLYREFFNSHIKANTKKAWGLNDTISTEDAAKRFWGLGLGIIETSHGRAFWHAGHTDGWRNYFIYYPRRDLGIIILSNSERFESVASIITFIAIKDSASPFEWLGWK